MSYVSCLFIVFGTIMVLMTGMRLRSTVAEGMHEFYDGRICKVSRAEQPRSYWARMLLMVSTAAAGVMLLCEGTALLHL